MKKKLTLVNFSQQDFWKMPDSFLEMIHKHFSQWEVRELKNLETDLHLLKDAQAIIGLPFPANLIRSNKELLWVHFLTNQIPLSWQKLKTKYDITHSEVSRRSVAEQALHLLLKGIRREVFYHQKVWSPANYQIAKLASHSNLGIIGHGGIGAIVSELTLSLFKEVRVLTSRPHAPVGTKKFSYDESPDFFTELDVVLICTEHNERTKTFFQNKSFYQQLKKDVILVNISRGELLVESDLVNFLQNNQQALYLSDVLSPEPYPPTGELMKLSNVYFSPHVGARYQGIWYDFKVECEKVLRNKNV